MEKQVKQHCLSQKVCHHIFDVLALSDVIAGSLLWVGDMPEYANEFSEKGYEIFNINPNDVDMFSAEKKNFVACVLVDQTLVANVGELLSNIRDFCKVAQIPLVVAERNRLFLNSVMETFQDAGTKMLGNSKLELSDLMAEHGFQQVNESNDIRENFLDEGHYSSGLLSSTLAHSYVSWLKNNLDENTNCYYFVQAYIPSIRTNNYLKKEIKKTPFLSIITRTQGNRIAELREVLLCLTAQTSDDFELLIIGHKTSEKNRLQVLKIIEETPFSLRNKISYFSLDQGNRSAPINFGISKASGRYAAILDDDDLVMDTWVEEFKNAANQHDGAILHAYTVGQKWKRGANSNELYAVAQTSNIYCQNYDAIQQIFSNRCPLMSLAFPMCIFKTSSLRFDETLDTTEDWDFLLRAAMIAGVKDISNVTSIYRLWENTTNSTTIHTIKEWQHNENIVKSRMNKLPILLPPGSAARLEKLYMDANLITNDLASARFRGVLYGDEGSGFCEKTSHKMNNLAALPLFHYVYQLDKQNGLAGKLRFDPCLCGQLMVSNFAATLRSEDGKEITRLQNECSSNGFVVNECFVFPGNSAEIYFDIPAMFKLREVVITGCIYPEIDAALLEKYINSGKEQGLLFVQCNDNNCLNVPKLLERRSVNGRELPHFNYIFPLNISSENISYMRFDPAEHGGIVIDELETILIMQDGSEKIIAQKCCGSNGYLQGEQFLFLKEDPQIYIPLPENEEIFEVHISGKLFQHQLSSFLNKAHPELAEPAMIFGDSGEGYGENSVYRTANLKSFPTFKYFYQFENNNEYRGAFRFDPVEADNAYIQNFLAVLNFSDGSMMTINAFDCCCNGEILPENEFVFFTEDPQIYIPIPQGVKVCSVELSGSLSFNIPFGKLLHAVGSGSVASLYIDTGEGFLPESVISSHNQKVWPNMHYEFAFNAINMKSGQVIRFDPSENRNILVRNFAAKLISPDGTEKILTSAQCENNGRMVGEDIVFLKEDPQILIPVTDASLVSKVIIEGELYFPIPDKVIDSLFAPPLHKRILRKLKRAFK